MPLSIKRMPDITLAQQIERLHTLKTEAQAASLMFEEYQRFVLEVMGDDKHADGVTHRVSVVRKETAKINEAGLKKALGAKVWNTMLKKSLDRKILEEKVKSGEVDVNIISQYTELVPVKPYIVFGELRDDPE